MSRLPVEIHFEVLDRRLWDQEPLTHENLCAVQKYADSSIDHARIVTAYLRSERNKERLLNIPNQYQLWKSRDDAYQHAKFLRSADTGTEPAPDILTEVIYDNCIPCFGLLRHHIRFRLDRYNDFGYSFLGLALYLGRHAIARGIANNINNHLHVTGSLNERFSGSGKIITLAARTGDGSILEPILDQIEKNSDAESVRRLLQRYIWKNDEAQLCKNSTPDLAMRLLKYRCNIADGIDYGNHRDTSWHCGLENPHGIPFMEFLRHYHPYTYHLSPPNGPNRPNANGETPLMGAVRSRRLDMVRWLVGIGVNVQHEDARGTTAAHLAAGLQTDESITMLEILLPYTNVNPGHQTAAGTILHSLVDGVRYAELEPSNSTTTRGHSARNQFHQQCPNHVDKKYRELRKYGIDQTLTNAANQTAAQYALGFGLGDLATRINSEPEDTYSCQSS
jgi:hypothetical protein